MSAPRGSGPAPVADMGYWGPCLLVAMPPEIQYKICRGVADGGEDTTSLARLARTCRALNPVAVSVLYRDIVQLPHAEIRDPGAPPAPVKFKAHHLACTLYKNPALGALVRSLRFEVPRFQDYEVDHQTLVDCCDAFEQLLDVDITTEYNSDNSDPISKMLLVCLSPNLATLHLTMTPKWHTTDFLLLRRANNDNDNDNDRRRRRRGAITRPRFTLPNLRTLTVAYRRYERAFAAAPRASGINLHKLNGLLHSAPNLASLTIRSPCGGTSLTARLPHLTTLKLHDAYLCARALRNLLRGCRNLVHFELSDSPTGPPQSRRFLPAPPGQVVEECLAAAVAHGSLRELWLAPSGGVVDGEYAGHPQAGDYHSRLLRRLGMFTALREVVLDYRAIAKVARPALLGEEQEEERLVGLLRGCVALEGVFLYKVEGISEEEVRGLAAAISPMMEWPRLEMVKFEGERWVGEVYWDEHGELIREEEEVELFWDAMESEATAAGNADLWEARLGPTGEVAWLARGHRLWLLEERGLDGFAGYEIRR